MAHKSTSNVYLQQMKMLSNFAVLIGACACQTKLHYDNYDKTLHVHQDILTLTTRHNLYTTQFIAIIILYISGSQFAA